VRCETQQAPSAEPCAWRTRKLRLGRKHCSLWEQRRSRQVATPPPPRSVNPSGPPGPRNRSQPRRVDRGLDSPQRHPVGSPRREEVRGTRARSGSHWRVRRLRGGGADESCDPPWRVPGRVPSCVCASVLRWINASDGTTAMEERPSAKTSYRRKRGLRRRRAPGWGSKDRPWGRQ